MDPGPGVDKMCGWSVLLVFLIISLGLMHRLLATTDLTVWQWVICIVFGSLVLWTTEIEKFFRRRAEPTSAAEPETVPADQATA